MKFPCHEINKCTGCKACVSVCKFDAIVMSEDKYGVPLPNILNDKCRNCHQCESVCPSNKEPIVYPIQECYAAIATDDRTYQTTSSGGAATIFAQHVLSNNGVVYGAAYIDNSVRHIRVEKIEDLDFIKGSKYVQSDTGVQYRYVKKDLDSDRKVLFIGTPCQVAGLKGYLRKSYSNLLTVDLICHGTPPFSYLNEHLISIVGNAQISDVSFRIKDWKLGIHGKETLLYSKINVEDYYCMAFAKGIIFRENCYKCSYAQPMRCSDITIGDFWGIGDTTLPNKSKSVVLVITDKGKKFWSECNKSFYYEKRNPQEAIEGNTQLRVPSVRPVERDKFLRAYANKDFRAGIRKSGIKFQVDLMRIKHVFNKKVIQKSNSYGLIIIGK